MQTFEEKLPPEDKTPLWLRIRPFTWTLTKETYYPIVVATLFAVGISLILPNMIHIMHSTILMFVTAIVGLMIACCVSLHLLLLNFFSEGANRTVYLRKLKRTLYWTKINSYLKESAVTGILLSSYSVLNIVIIVLASSPQISSPLLSLPIPEPLIESPNWIGTIWLGLITYCFLCFYRVVKLSL